MATVTDILGGLRNHLVTQAIVRRLDVPGPLPPMVLDPRKGPPAPGDDLEGAAGASLIVSALPGVEIPPGEGDGYMLRATVDLRYRGKYSDAIAALNGQIVAEMYEPGGRAKQAWNMGGLFVLETRGDGGLTRLGSDGNSFDYLARLYVETYR